MCFHFYKNLGCSFSIIIFKIVLLCVLASIWYFIEDNQSEFSLITFRIFLFIAQVLQFHSVSRCEFILLSLQRALSICGLLIFFNSGNSYLKVLQILFLYHKDPFIVLQYTQIILASSLLLFVILCIQNSSPRYLQGLHQGVPVSP